MIKNKKKRKPPSGRRWLSSSGYLPTPRAGSPRKSEETNQHYFNRKYPHPSREKAKSKNGKKEGRLCISGAVGGLRYEIVMCKSHIVLYRKCPWPSKEKL